MYSTWRCETNQASSSSTWSLISWKNQCALSWITHVYAWGKQQWFCITREEWSLQTAYLGKYLCSFHPYRAVWPYCNGIFTIPTNAYFDVPVQTAGFTYSFGSKWSFFSFCCDTWQCQWLFWIHLYSSVQAVETENRKHFVLECKALIPHNQMSLISPGLCGFWGNMYRWI